MVRNMVWIVAVIMHCFGIGKSQAQELPLGYREYFSHTCATPDLFANLTPDDSSSWLIIADKPVNCLRIKPPDSLRGVYPESRAMLHQWIWGDYILSFQFKAGMDASTDSAGFVFIGAARDPENYYAFCFVQDSIRFFWSDKGSLKRISTKAASNPHAGWNSLIVRRDILTRSFTFILNDAPEPVVFSHRDLVMGYSGFGGHLTTCYLRKITLWAPTVIDERIFTW